MNISGLAYLGASVLFILALRGLSSPETSRRGNQLGMLGMALAIVTTIAYVVSDVASVQWTDFVWLGCALLIGAIVGITGARRIAMTAMPQLVAAFHSLVGLAAVMVAAAAYAQPAAFGLIDDSGQIYPASRIEMALGMAIGALTFSGSLVAFAKLQGIMTGSPLVFPGQHLLNALVGIAIVTLLIAFAYSPSSWTLLALTVLAFLIGLLLIMPIGGADMPVIVSMLNSYSGWAAAGIGFTLHNNALIVTGALVGSSGAILSYIMCKSMNRSFINVLLGGFGSENSSSKLGDTGEERPVKQGSAEDAAFIMKNSGSVIIVPGYGMAVAQAQHALKEMAEVLKREGVKVSYAIHPVAGRMPGHMNVLLAEANVPYDEVFELEDINNEFQTADVVYVIGANDVTNPAAKSDPTSPIFGMPVLEVEKARTVLFVKRGMATGYAGVQNELFYKDNTMMLFGDAKKMTESIVRFL
jgi:NAD(P) transhydrogenase subunit beta